MIKGNVKMFFFLLFFLTVGLTATYPIFTFYGMNIPASRFVEQQQVAEKISSPNSRHITLSELKSIQEQQIKAKEMERIVTSSGEESVSQSEWKPDQEQLTIETVLVPRRVTVISSSQDGKISDVLKDNGDSFKKDDILIQYDCSDLEAEAAIAGIQKNLTQKKREGINRLFKLDIISDVDRLSIETEDSQANAKIALYKARLESCVIRAQFDGHVTKRLANPSEYTRTDRVLMEIASDEPLQAQFLLPSKWLRWVNQGAPLIVSINENGRKYPATITRLYGEIDPVSQSIQVVATLNDYPDTLLPGMSGQAVLDVRKIEKAGIKGYLQSVRNP